MTDSSGSNVIYICSDVRSGSTLIDMILSQHPKITSVGEGHHFHDFLNNQYYNYKTKESHCTCGEDFHDCGFWQQIISELSLDSSIGNLKEQQTKYPRFKSKLRRFYVDFRNIILPSSAIRFIESKSGYYRKVKAITDFRFKIFGAINKVNNSLYVMDSSKWPEATKLFNVWRKNEVKIIFLKRDIRAIAYSKHTRRPNKTSINNALKDSFKNRLIQNLYQWSVPRSSYITVDYQSFTERPSVELKRIGVFLGLDNCEGLVDQEQLKVKHNLGGSPHRFNDKIKISTDERWKHDKELKKELEKSLIHKVFFNKFVSN